METTFASAPKSPMKTKASGSGWDTVRSLDRLLERSCHELEGMYRLARAPRLMDVQGDLRGRMLAWPVLDAYPLLGEGLRAFASSRGFPWRGKSFRPFDDDRGEGVNRVLSDRVRLFRFDTSIGRSRAGDFDALHLDYDLDGNPSFIRRVEDEIREIEPGVWLGQAYYRTARGRWLWLYFGLARGT
jgi:hypothetical protein